MFEKCDSSNRQKWVVASFSISARFTANATITWNFERTQCFNVEANFLKNENLFQKTGVPFFSWKYCDWKRNISIQNCPVEKPILRQIEWGVQDRPITKNGVLPVTALFFRKFCFNLRTSYKEFIWCTNQLYTHIHTFRKRWSIIWGAFSQWVSLKDINM